MYPKPIDIVDILRPSEAVPEITKEAIKLKKWSETPKVIWMQLRIVNEDVAEQVKEKLVSRLLWTGE